MIADRQQIKSLVFRLLGKDPRPVIVSFATGDAVKVRAMVEEARALLPGYRHFLAGLPPVSVPGVTPLPLQPGSAWSLYWQLKHTLGPVRIGMAPLLLDDDGYAPLRAAAFLMAPGRILAYNQRLERYHLQLRTPISSWLFARGVALDRIHLRPRWLPFLKGEPTTVPDDALWIEGRPPRRGRRRIGVLTPFLPYPLSHGGAVRLFYLLRALAEMFDVYLFAFRESQEVDPGPLVEFLSGIGTLTKPRYREPRWSTLLPPEVAEYASQPMRRLIDERRRRHHIELLQVEFTQLASYTGDILVEHDVTFDLFEQVRRRQPGLAAWWNGWRWQRFERAALRRFRRVVVMSDKDRALLGTANTRVIPNGVDLARFRPAQEPPGERLLFIGSFRHFPNATAFRFLVEEVWPLLKRRRPGVTLTVVAGPDPRLHWTAATGLAGIPDVDGIEVLGFVRDVVPLYERANVVLVPTLVSAGTNLKVLEAMAMHRAIVSTSSGVGGLDVEHGRDVWIADGGVAFATAIETLLGDHVLRGTLSASARALVERLYDWRELGKMQVELVEGLLPDTIQIRPGSMADLSEVRRIQREALPSSRWDAIHYLEHDFLVAQSGSVLCGFIVARYTGPDEREVLNIAVDPGYRCRGIGEKLLRRLIGKASGEVFLEVRESNTSARRLYERIGFIDVGRRPNYYDDPPETAVVMRIHSLHDSSASERRT